MNYNHLTEKELLVKILQKLESIETILSHEKNISDKIDTVAGKLDKLKDYHEILEQIISVLKE